MDLQTLFNEIQSLKEMMKCNQRTHEKRRKQVKCSVSSHGGNNMPTLKDCSFRKRTDGVFEYRFRKHGFNKSFSSVDIAVAKRKCLTFLRELNQTLSDKATSENRKSYNFEFWADQYFEYERKPQLAEKSYQVYYNRYKIHIIPYFRGKDIRNITSFDLQKRINAIIEEGHGRTAEDVATTLRGIFRTAIVNEVRKTNPMDIVNVEKHIRQNGKRLTWDDERKFVQLTKGTYFEYPLLLILYTGLRPGEVPTVSFDLNRGFVIAENSKRKTKKKEFKEIPINPMLAPLIPKLQDYDFKSLNSGSMSKNFHKLMPDYTCYDLRHTFNSNAYECGIPEEIRNLWMGHGNGSINTNIYVHPSDDFQKTQALKLFYDYSSPQFTPQNAEKNAVSFTKIA